MMLAEPNDPGIGPMLAGVRQQKQDMKIILRLAGCSQDDLNTQTLVRVDLMLNPDLSEADVLAKLEGLLK
jgi:hypothetical protein